MLNTWKWLTVGLLTVIIRLPVLTESLPADFGKMETYVEPFVGGGALFF